MSHMPNRLFRRAIVSLAFLLATAGAASAQTPSSDWNIGAYPVFVWLPTNISLDLSVPPGDGGDVGSIAESRFDGAYFAAFYASKGWFRTDTEFVWAAIGGDRVDRPAFSVDTDIIYLHATGGVRLAPGFYATAGVRRVALNFDLRVTNFPSIERKPGVWDPVVGVGYHYEGKGRPFEFHATFDGGGFGVGADHEYGAMARLDWKPVTHFGITGGYSLLNLAVTDTRVGREIKADLTVHGPIFGVGFYF